MQYGLVTIDDQRMPGVMPALKTRYCLRALGEQVNDLTFTLVPPLGADNHYVLRHSRSIALFLRHYNPSTRFTYELAVTPHIGRCGRGTGKTGYNAFTEIT